MAEVQLAEDNFKQVSDELAVYLSDADGLPPDVCPDLLPAGWVVADIPENPLDFEFTNGDWREVYILERGDA